MSLEGKVLSDRAEVRQESLSALGQAEAPHTPFAFPGWLMTILGAVVDAGTGFDEDVFDVCQFGNFGLRGRIAAQLIGDNPSWRVGTGGQHAVEEALCCGLVAMFLQQDVEFGAVLVDCPPEQIRLTAQRNEDFVQMPCAPRLAASSFDAMCEARAEFVAPAADRLVTDNDTALEQQFFNVTQAKLEPEIPPNRETNDCRREPVAVIKRFSFVHRDILRDYLANVTVPSTTVPPGASA